MDRTTSPPVLYYWPSLQGRGELIRLILAEAGVAYIDQTRLSDAQSGGAAALMRLMREGIDGVFPLAPPVLVLEGRVLSQTANICLFLGERFGLCPPELRYEANQLMLALLDLLDEIHNTHHPLGKSLYFEDQRDAAIRASGLFVTHRIPKYFTHFERVLEHNDGEHLIGDAVSYVDIVLFQLLTGLRYAFPAAIAHYAPQFPRLDALHARIQARPNIAAYLSSDARIPFNTHGIFRHYPELNLTPTTSAA